jgi:glycosyltransferase involved in cell wall biosynthesis
MEPLVSVVIPTYNRAKYLVDAVNSVLGQTYPSIEAIVVDDGSTDNTREVLKKYRGKITYIQQERKERSGARNKGVLTSKGDYVGFLDSDDLWCSNKVMEQMRVFENDTDIGVVYTDVVFIDKNGKSCSPQQQWDAPIRDEFYEDLMTHNVVTGSTSSIVVKKKCFAKVGLFDESMNACEDLDLYRRIARYYGFKKVDLPLVKIRLHDDNSQSDLALMAKGWETTIRKIWNDTPSRYAYYRDEATIKLLSKIARCYWQSSRRRAFFWFLMKAVMSEPKWPLRPSLWVKMAQMLWERLPFQMEKVT